MFALSGSIRKTNVLVQTLVVADASETERMLADESVRTTGGDGELEGHVQQLHGRQRDII